MATLNLSEWNALRSDIYIRDKGICWVCNEFVDLRDYELGHLVDRCKGGDDTYDNLAVMHHHCNRTKPRHLTLEAAIKWKLDPTYLEREPTKTLPKVSKYHYVLESYKKYGCSPLMASFTPDKRSAIKQFILEYFTGHPELSQKQNRKLYNTATRQLAATLGIEVPDVRLILCPIKT